MEKSDLARFCGDQGGDRPYLEQPFSVGDYTYATNGHIMVRVPRREDVPELSGEYESKKTVNWDKPLAGHEKAEFAPLKITLPPLPESGEKCEECDGTGKVHTCPSCACPCAECGGSGKTDPEQQTSTTINGLFYAMHYARRMLSLPDVEVATRATSKDDPLLFRFRGGIGALMPLRHQKLTHVETQAARGV